MIFIVSRVIEACTEDVISWLKHYKHNFIRVNATDTVDIIDISTQNKEFKIVLSINDRFQIDLSSVTAYWYRRGDLNLFQFESQKNKIHHYFQTYLTKEISVVQSLIYKELEKKFHINKRIDNETNKLINLIYASDCGLKIPNFSIKTTTNKEEELTQNYITKAFYHGGFRVGNEYEVTGKTERIEQLYQSRFPSFLQVEIDKKYEIRTFYIMGELYSIAIFSQQNEKTKVDFRNYDAVKPNRLVPFTIAPVLAKKIDAFMKLSGLNCGSLDFIYTPEGEFYFLEVNPIGQFQQVSIPGNYYLEKIIAEKLIHAHG